MNNSMSSWLAMLGIPPQMISMLTGSAATAPQQMPQQQQKPMPVGQQAQLGQQSQGIGNPGQGSSPYSIPPWLTQGLKSPVSGMGGAGGPGGGSSGGTSGASSFLDN